MHSPSVGLGAGAVTMAVALSSLETVAAAASETGVAVDSSAFLNLALMSATSPHQIVNDT